MTAAIQSNKLIRIDLNPIRFRNLYDRLNHSYLLDEVGQTFDVGGYRDNFREYRDVKEEINVLSGRVIALQKNPTWEKAAFALRGLSLLVASVATAALAIWIFCVTAPTQAMSFAIILWASSLWLSGFCMLGAINDVRAATESLQTVQDKLAAKNKIAVELENNLAAGQETLRKIKESLIAKNAAYGQLAKDPIFSHAATQAKKRNLSQLAIIAWLNILS